LGDTIKYLQRTTSGAAGNGLGTTIKCLQKTTSGATGYDLGASVKFLRLTLSGAAGYGRATRSSTCVAPRNNERRSGQRLLGAHWDGAQ
jgi:hypothetical protein